MKIILILFLFCSTLLASEVAVNKSADPEVDELVKQLVSPVPAPYPTGYWGRYQLMNPSNERMVVTGYMHPEVREAQKKLRSKGTIIFPDLLEHIRDDRYCYSGVYAAWVNHSVGEAIKDLMCDGYIMHSGYKSRETPSGHMGYPWFNNYLKEKDIDKWVVWAANKSRLEIQLNFIDWCLEKEDAAGYVSDEQKNMIHARYKEAKKEMTEKYSQNQQVDPIVTTPAE